MIFYIFYILDKTIYKHFKENNITPKDQNIELIVK